MGVMVLQRCGGAEAVHVRGRAPYDSLLYEGAVASTWSVFYTARDAEKMPMG